MATYAFELPELGEGIASGDVVNVLVVVGDVVVQEQPVLELETDKAVIEIPAPVSCAIRTLHVQTGDTAAVGQLIVTFETDSVAPAPPVAVAAPPPEAAPPMARESAVEAPPPAPSPSPPTPPGRVAAASPSVRRLAREVGVEIDEVAGSGPGGRINVEDVKRHARSLLTDTEPFRPTVESHTVQLPDFTCWGEVERQPMSGVRRATADHMAQAWATIPHVTQHAKADITELDQLRKRFASHVEDAGGRLTITAMMLKVVAAALKVFPHFNASLDMANHDIIYKRYLLSHRGGRRYRSWAVGAGDSRCGPEKRAAIVHRIDGLGGKSPPAENDTSPKFLP